MDQEHIETQSAIVMMIVIEMVYVLLLDMSDKSDMVLKELMEYGNNLKHRTNTLIIEFEHIINNNELDENDIDMYNCII